MSKKTKLGICALAVALALACGVGAYAARVPATVMIAERLAAENDFAAASERLEGIETPKAEILLKYVQLRADINGKFPVLLEKFDASVIESWSEQAQFLGKNEESLLKEDFAFASQRLSNVLLNIIRANNEYNSARGDILDLMDVFAEFGRLHSRVDGKNVSFTVSQENEKLNRWKKTYDTLADFSGKYLKGSSSYLFSYLISEAGAEFATLQSAIDVILQSGYSADDVIRYNDEIQTVYPDITNQNGVAVNLLDKQGYEEYMYKDVCGSLVSSLAEFYAVKG